MYRCHLLHVHKGQQKGGPCTDAIMPAASAPVTPFPLLRDPCIPHEHRVLTTNIKQEQYLYRTSTLTGTQASTSTGEQVQSLESKEPAAIKFSNFPPGPCRFAMQSPRTTPAVHTDISGQHMNQTQRLDLRSCNCGYLKSRSSPWCGHSHSDSCVVLLCYSLRTVRQTTSILLLS
jgi:hypothetical protein